MGKGFERIGHIYSYTLGQCRGNVKNRNDVRNGDNVRNSGNVRKVKNECAKQKASRILLALGVR
ncbi:hypothetical protein BCT23_17350 [Enterovibrio norvegicus]|uniref:Uncharacterized protein n=1 Tax=Enterovibrio norvegicus TaxID=188144 RepID=A0A2N7LA14_9GAMM|nr:hypothetical protein BCT23_17350 [Enterovibrio norvegicus]